MDYYKQFTPISLITKENSLIILPFKIIIKNRNSEIKFIKKNLDSNEILNIVSELEKLENFNNYSNIYIGNKNITDYINETKNATSSNQ